MTTEDTGLRKYSGHRSTNGAQSAARRRSYRRVVYAELARLPEGPTPPNCEHGPTVADKTVAKLRQKSSKVATIAAFLAFLIPTAFADQIVQTYLAGKVEAPPNTQLAQHGPTVSPVFGTETFDTRPLGGLPIVSNFGTGTVIVGTFSGTYTVSAANQYGGAGGGGRFISTTSSSPGLNVKLTHSGAIPGINYFGLAISALDAGNTVVLKRNGTTVITYAPVDLIKAVGACPNTNNPYCGNPVTGLNGNEQYAFVNFFDRDNYFDEIVLTETGGGYESDNFTFGYVDTNFIFGTSTNVPEPGSLPIVLAGLLGVAAATQLARRRPGASVVSLAGMGSLATA